MYKIICEVSDALLLWRRVFSSGHCREEDGVFVGRVESKYLPMGHYSRQKVRSDCL